MTHHVPVLLQETINAFHPFKGQLYVDGTLGAGGHASLLASKLTPSQKLIGLDRDPKALAIAKEKLDSLPDPKSQVQVFQQRFAQLETALAMAGIHQFENVIDGGILLDLGMSNIQLKSTDRGFSFQTDAPLDMRMDDASWGGPTAADVVNTWPEEELAEMMKKYSDERLAKPIARAIVETRAETPFKTTKQLASIASRLYEQKGVRDKHIHPATRLFQALRIAVNEEFEQLETFLEKLPTWLAPGAIVAIISFHSLEDRIVKQSFRRHATDCICPPNLPICQCGHKAALKIIDKPIRASEAETKQNPQARSATLRVAQKLP